MGSGTAAAALRGVISSPTSTSGSTSIQRSPTASLVSVQTSPSATSVKGTKTISAPQIVYQRQQHIQLKQQQLRVIQSRTPSSPGQKVSVAVTASSPTQRIQQVNAYGHFLSFILYLELLHVGPILLHFPTVFFKFSDLISMCKFIIIKILVLISRCVLNKYFFKWFHNINT